MRRRDPNGDPLFTRADSLATLLVLLFLGVIFGACAYLVALGLRALIHLVRG